MMPINWNLFCDAKAWRFPALASPIVRGGIKYATNAKVLIAVPCNEPDAQTTERYPACEPILAGICRVNNWAALPAIAECDHCKGTGCCEIPAHPCGCDGGKQDCSECDGSGHVECEYFHEHVCPECCGSGRETCEECDGAGTIPVDVAECPKCKDAIPLLGRQMRRRDLLAMQTLAPVLVGTVPGSDSSDVVYFKFGDGCRGAVCPLLQEVT